MAVVVRCGSAVANLGAKQIKRAILGEIGKGFTTKTTVAAALRWSRSGHGSFEGEREREREGVMISLFLWRLNQTGDCKRGQETQEANQKRDYTLSGIRGPEGLGV